MKILASTFAARKAAGQRFAALTAYDYVFGRLLDDAGLDFILVGDSLGMVSLGDPDTTSVTVDQMLHHVRAVAAGVQKTPLVADLPKGAYEDAASALATASRLQKAGADAVKLEGGVEVRPQIDAIIQAGIPFIGHLGMLPQKVREEGGYHIKGRTPGEAEALMEGARALEQSGVAAIVLELVVPEVAAQITAAVRCPTIGIGSGPGCDGQILVTHDLLGFFPWFRPRFVTPKADLAASFLGAVNAYCKEVRAGSQKD